MYLALQDLALVFPKTRGATENLDIYTVTDDSECIQPKGVFIPVDEKSGEIMTAIANGAIAAIWDMEKQIPAYIPNHFPLLFTADAADAIRTILAYYLEKLDGETDTKMNMTNFIFLNKKLLNKNNESYDIAGILNKIAEKEKTKDAGRRG